MLLLSSYAQNAGENYHQSLDGFDFTPQATVNKPLMLELMRGGDLDAREHILLVGASGTG